MARTKARTRRGYGRIEKFHARPVRLPSGSEARGTLRAIELWRTRSRPRSRSGRNGIGDGNSTSVGEVFTRGSIRHVARRRGPANQRRCGAGTEDFDAESS